MAYDEIQRKIAEFQERVDKLQQHAIDGSTETQETLREAIEQLNVALEELLVAEEELRLQSSDLPIAYQQDQHLFEFAPDAYVVTDTGGIIQKANRNAIVLLNVSREFVEGKPLISFFIKREQKAFHTQLSWVKQVHQIRGWETRMQPRRRKAFDASVSAATMTAPDGSKTIGLCWLIRDVNERKEVKIAEEARAYAESVLETVRQPLIVLDSSLRVVSANRFFYKTFRVSKKETEGQFIYELGNHQWDIPEIRKLLGEILPKHRHFHDFEVDHEFPGIGHRTMMLNGRQIYRKDVPTSLILLAIEDITERRRAEEKLRQSESRYRNLSESLEETVKKQVDQLRRAESLAAIGKVVSVVAHEVRNPLQNIRMGVDAIREQIGKDEDTLAVLKEVEHGVRLVDEIVSELLEYSRPIRLDRSSWWVKDIVVQALGMVSQKVKNISVQLDVDQKEVFVDANKMMRVLVNLISNAADAMPEGGNLTIRSQFCEGGGGVYRLSLSISDNGCGISEENLRLIQEPFFTTKTQGIGLGISICRKIIEAHEGTLNITSKVNEGTTVEIVLPVRLLESGKEKICSPT